MADGTKVLATFMSETANQDEFGQDATVQGVKWPNGKVVIRVAEGRA